MSDGDDTRDRISAPAAIASGDRRIEARAPIELRVEYKRLNSFFADYTKNIGRGGTFIQTEKPLAVGTDFIFKLGVPALEDPLILAGRVQWTVTPEQADAAQPPGMGIRFVFDSDQGRQAVEATVERLMVDSLGPVLYEKLLAKRRTS